MKSSLCDALPGGWFWMLKFVHVMLPLIWIFYHSEFRKLDYVFFFVVNCD